MVVDVAPHHVPDVPHELPLSNQAGAQPRKQERGIQLTGPSSGGIRVESDGAPRRAKGRLGLSAPARAFDQHSTRRAEPERELVVGEPRQVGLDPSKLVSRCLDLRRTQIERRIPLALREGQDLHAEERASTGDEELRHDPARRNLAPAPTALGCAPAWSGRVSCGS